MNNSGSRLNYASQARELTARRSHDDWIAAVSQTCQQQALRDLDKAFSNVFKGVARYPAPRRKGVNDSFRLQGREVEVGKLNGKRSAVRLPKIGRVKFRDTRPLRGRIKNVTVALDALGWHVSFTCEIERIVPATLCPPVGIDRGIANTLTLSTGERLSGPRSLDAIDRRCRAAQRTAARRKKGSKRRLAAIRRDWHHRVALEIAKRFGTVVLEDLRIRNMTASARGAIEEPGRRVRQKAGLNRSIRNQGWFGFETILACKLEERGGYFLKVDPAYTSQTCSECGAVDRQNRKSQAAFVCRLYGFRTHAGHKAAINILRRNTASMRMEEGHWLSGEVRTQSRKIPAENPPASAGRRC